MSCSHNELVHNIASNFGGLEKPKTKNPLFETISLLLKYNCKWCLCRWWRIRCSFCKQFEWLYGTFWFAWSNIVFAYVILFIISKCVSGGLNRTLQIAVAVMSQQILPNSYNDIYLFVFMNSTSQQHIVIWSNDDDDDDDDRQMLWARCQFQQCALCQSQSPSVLVHLLVSSSLVYIRIWLI